MKKIGVIIGIFIILLTTAVYAEDFFVQCDSTQGKDTYIIEGTPNQNFGVNNKLEIRGNDNRRALIEFNLSSIPSNAIINNANLELYLFNKGSSSSINVSIQRITHEWTEGTGNGDVTEDGATWNTYNGTSNWDISGGDFDSYIWTITEVSSNNKWYSYDLTNLVQSWVNNTYENYGMIIRNMRENSGEWKFASSDNTNSSIYPKLNITYTIPDTTSPSSVTNLQNQSNGLDFIYWTWTNPTDPDYLENIIYLDNINILNTTNNFYNATSLLEDTEYLIKIHTIDTNHNVNNTDVTNTARTSKSPCVENWNCIEWNECINGTQTRICTDLNSCGTELNKPIETQECVMPCEEDWLCSEWSSCINSTQIRTCTDQNSCGTEINKPEETQNCTVETPGGGSGGGGGGSNAPSTVYQTGKTEESIPKIAETKQETKPIETNQNKQQITEQQPQEIITSSVVKEPSFVNKNLKHIITSIILVILAIFIYRKEVKDL